MKQHTHAWHRVNDQEKYFIITSIEAATECRGDTGVQK